MGQCYAKKCDINTIITSDNPIDSSCTSPIELLTCSICLEEISKLDQFTVPNCRHQFHRKCISEWNKNSNECPNCRGEIVAKIKVSDFVYQFLLERERIEQEESQSFNTYNRNRYNNVILQSRRIMIFEDSIQDNINEEDENYF